jgi:hypothetical protein
MPLPTPGSWKAGPHGSLLRQPRRRLSRRRPEAFTGPAPDPIQTPPPLLGRGQQPSTRYVA